ncbi:MAG TPA: metallophosphoesterase [Candidatus Hydrogenedentes bacterium]|nr:metallophosphoesterase [Candidatus Hydrogenedentota bacterium]HRZ81470.1 metallophosphoesterase [Candidatus Hydrogenedentota bacterium]
MSTEPFWHFVHLSDPHLSSTHDGVWNSRFLCTMMPDLMARLGEDLRALRPEFLLVTGDIVSVKTREGMLAARDGLEVLGIPYYPLGGNHDFVLPESREWFLEAFAHRLPERNTFYGFEHRNLRFHVLDAWWEWSGGELRPVPQDKSADEMDEDLKGLHWGIPEDQLVWLENRLSRPFAGWDVVAVHYPAMRVPDRLRFEGFRDGGRLVNGAGLLALMNRFSRARAVFSGHVHVHFAETVGHVTQVTTGSLPEYPSEYRVVRVFEDRMEAVATPLSDPSFAARSFLPGRELTAGQPQDRSVVIPLK